MIARTLFVSFAVCTFGCSSGDAAPTGGASGAGGAGGGGGTGGAGGSTGALEGTFTVALKPATPATMTPAFTLVSGNVYDGPVPPVLPLVEARAENGCHLLKPKLPFCSAGCGTAVCVDTDTCVPYPHAQNVGVVRVAGLGNEEVQLDPFPPSFAYQSTALPNPPCTEGADIRVTADAFTMQGRCIAPFDLAAGTISVKRGQPVSLTWAAPSMPDIARVQIRLDISHHGGKKGEIDCDVPDTGSFEIPASLVTELVDLGLAGFPTIQVERATSSPSTQQPKIALIVSSPIEREVDTGIKSCTSDMDCPAGQTCNTTNLTCQ